MTRFRSKWILIPLALLVVGALSYGITLALQSGATPTTAQTAAPPSLEELNEFRAELDRQKAADDALPRQSGEWGDFEIVSDDEEASPALLCPAGLADGSTGFVDSELNKPNMTEQAVCSDGTVVAVYSATGRRSYFEGKAKVSAIAPTGRLILEQIDGRPALIVEPPTDYGAFFVYVIQRPSSPEQRGIMVSLMGGINRDQAIEMARKALAE